MPESADVRALHRPAIGPLGAWFALGTGVLVALAVIEGVLHLVGGAPPAGWLHAGAAWVAYDLGITAVLAVAVAWRLRAALPTVSAPPALSVLVAAYDEAEHIVPTVRALSAQTGVAFEILVGDDGSRDATFDLLRAAFDLSPVDGALWRGAAEGQPLSVLRLPHAGKGATLNALAAHARYPVLVTVDADTLPAPHALARLAAAFDDPAVTCAAGVVTVRDARGGWLLRHQSTEYLRTAFVRIGWAALGALEQVPGAFTGVRADAFAAAGGFPTDSLTEDYELTYRLIARGVRDGVVPVVAAVPGAQVFTEAPRTLAGFVRQRTRWFAGFLSTLARFRGLVGERRAGAFGLVRLPLKLAEATLPVLTWATLLTGLGAASLGASRAALALFALRAAFDVGTYALARRASSHLGDAAASAAVSPGPVVGAFTVLTEALGYLWLRQFGALRGWLWALRRATHWEPSRTPARSAIEASRD
jgi:GT2 family glycosyltransferase